MNRGEQIEPEVLEHSMKDFIRFLVDENLISVPPSMKVVLVPFESIKGSLKVK